jgi:hypothetical protein
VERKKERMLENESRSAKICEGINRNESWEGKTGRRK